MSKKIHSSACRARLAIIISCGLPQGVEWQIGTTARENAAVFENNGVLEVTVGRRVFPCNQQEVNNYACNVMLCQSFLLQDIPTALHGQCQLGNMCLGCSTT